MWGKVGIIISVVTTYIVVSLVYAQMQIILPDLGSATNAWNGGIDIPIPSSITLPVEAFQFFYRMFIFGVPNVPFVFTVFWWLMGFALGLAVFLLIRGD